MDAVTWVEAPPASDAYARLRAAVGREERPDDALKAVPRRALYSVCGYQDGALVACGRVVGMFKVITRREAESRRARLLR